MQIELPIFRQISRDARLAPRAFQVWRSAIELLDLCEWRELKLTSIEHDLEIDPSTVSRALSLLVERGYLCRKEPSVGLSALYRVPLSRRACDDQPVTADASQVVAPPEVSEGVPTRRARSRILSRGVL